MNQSRLAAMGKIIGAMEVIRHMSDTIEEFRSFHQPEKEKTPYDPCRCISSAVSLFAPHFQSDGITLEVEALLDEAKVSWYGYPNEFKHVIINLTPSARHHS